MADEIAQVCQMEIEGIKMVFKGTLETAQILMRMIRSIIEFSKKQFEKRNEKQLLLPGEKDLKDIIKLSSGPPQILKIPESLVQDILEEGSKKGLHFSYIIDFDPNDGMVPIVFTAEEASIWAAIINAKTSVKLEEDTEKIKDYDTKISEEKEKMHNAKTPEEREAIKTRLENLEQAREEAAKSLADTEELCKQENMGMSLTDYLKSAKGTEFEKNPEKAIAELEKGVEIGPQITAKECLQPIRDKSYMPNTALMFYLPDTGSIITREFFEDKETGLMYSNYSFKTQDGEIHRYTDHNLTSEKWNQEILPNLMDKANLIEGTDCRMFDKLDKLHAYLQYHNQVRPESEIRIEKAIKEGQPVFSSAETEQEVNHAISQKMKGLVSARVENERITISVDPNQLVRQGGKLSLRLDGGNTFLISGMDNERIEGGKAVFEIEKDAKILHIKDNFSDYPQTNQITGVECKEMIDNAMTNVMENVQKHNHNR